MHPTWINIAKLVTADMIADRMRETAGGGRFVTHATEVEPGVIAPEAVTTSAAP